jgi:hypothetical protein
MPIENPIRNLYRPRLDQKTDEWVVFVPSSKVSKRVDGNYEVRLPLYLTRTYLSIGGAILRPIRRKYRDWLLAQQNGKCAECGCSSDHTKGYWTLDHQPPLSQSGAKFIDYERTTKNRVIHQSCDKAQTRKKTP